MPKMWIEDKLEPKLGYFQANYGSQKAHLRISSSLSPFGRSQHVWAQKLWLLINFSQSKMHTIFSVRYSQKVAPKS